MRRTFDGKPGFPLPLTRGGAAVAAVRGESAAPRPPAAGARVARNVHYVPIRMRTLFIVLLAAALLAASQVRAESAILLQEILPSLAGTDLGAVPVANAPPPGAVITIRRGDVLRALRAAGKSGEALQIPRATQISRAVVSLPKQRVAEEAQDAVAEAAAPCQVEQLRVSADAKVVAGPRTLHAELNLRGAPLNTKTIQVTGAVLIDSAGTQVRVPVVAKLSCPPPDVVSGAQVTLIAVVGPVRASAAGEARQGGRTGDIIRVTNRSTGAALRGRIVDASTVEVVP